MAVLVAVCGPAQAAAPAESPAFELTSRQRLTFAGEVLNVDDAKTAGVTFGVIPTSLISSKPYYNVFTGMVENRPVAGNPHPIPVLRAANVSVYASKPDLGQLALDRVSAFSNEAQIKPDSAYAIAGDGNGVVRLITFTHVHVPQDKTGEWKLSGTSEPITLVGHIDDPVADMGRAVLTEAPLPLTGRLVYGTRTDVMRPTTFHAIDLPDGKPSRIAEAVEGRVAGNGNLVDRVDMKTLRITDRAGKRLGEVKLAEGEIAEFNIAPDGRRVLLSTQRPSDPKDSWSKRETVTIVYKIEGRKVGEIVGYDDAAFLPDGNLVLTGENAGPGLFLGELKTGRVTPLTLKDGPRDSDGRAADPEWPRLPVVSPDGKQVAYHSGRDVFVVGTDGRGWTPVFNTPDHEPQASPVFSPDGRFIAMIVVPLNVMNGPGTLHVFDIKKHVRQTIDAARGANSEIPMTWQSK